MTNNFQSLTDEQYTKALEDFLFPHLLQTLATRELGHCMRVADLELPLMMALVRRLRKEQPNAQVYLLGEAGNATENNDLFITSTKLVELRNPPANGQLRPPLMVFVSPNLRSSVEDSISVATFEALHLDSVYSDLIRKKMNELPVEYRGVIRELLTSLPKQQWHWADLVAQLRFLLTATNNGKDAESIGASLYELGLVPDFQFLQDISRSPVRWQQNLEAMKKLIYSDLSIRGRVSDLGITDKEVQRHLTNFLLETGTDDPRWTQRIALERSHSKTISWDKWKLKSMLNMEQVAIMDVETDLKAVSEEQATGSLQGLQGELFLDPGIIPKLKVTFQVDPIPNQVEGLTHFTVQIIAENGGPVGAAKKVKVGVRNKVQFSISLDKLNQVEFVEGWHFVRVLPWAGEDDPIALVKGADGSTQNESEPFFVVTNSEVNETPAQRAIPREVSLEHARLKLQFSSQQQEPESVQIQRVFWPEKAGTTRATSPNALEVKFGKLGAVRILVARQLQLIERRILETPVPVTWRLNIKAGRPDEPEAEAIEWQKSMAFESFIAAREKFFSAVSGSEGELILQGADLLALADVGVEYAESYRSFLRDLQYKIERSEGAEQHRHIVMLRSALALDMVRVAVTGFDGQTREAALLGPTHPLRTLWLVNWAKLGQQWLMEAKQGPEEYLASTRDAILREIALLNYPATLPLPKTVFTSVDNIHPFWSLYASPKEDDPRGLLGEVCFALAMDEPAIGGAAVTKEILASRIERYLVQHPYLRTLSINAFNPGRATVLAEAIEGLTELRRKKGFARLRYDVRLFVPDQESPGVGQAIEELLSLSEEESDEVGETKVVGSTHLFPKMTLAIHGNEDFRQNPRNYRAHISLLFDLFPAADIGAELPWQPDSYAPIHGLVQDFLTSYQDDESGQFWRKQPRHGRARPLPEAEHLSGLLEELPAMISGATATVASGFPAFDKRPVITLSLGAKQRSLIYDVHDVSDWVFTIDRNLGIEFFDHGKPGERPDYLIDYVPGGSLGQGHRMLITSRSIAEIQAMLQPVLERHRLPTGPSQAALILDQLRALSGRLALKLISSPNHQKEALGLALSRLYLKYQGVLSNQIILPLDAHVDLFRTVKKLADEAGQESTLQRTDLAVFDLNAAARTIHCHLVEVKCHDWGASLSQFAQLKQSIPLQLAQSEKVLRHHFDSQAKPDRPDRLLKTRELNTLLSFYLDRSARYGLIHSEAIGEAQTMLDSLENGYQLKFTKSALIFDFEKSGTDEVEKENDVEFYRIGKDLIQLLVAQEGGSVTEEEVSATIPKLSAGAFIAVPRDRTVSAVSIPDTDNVSGSLIESNPSNKVLDLSISSVSERDLTVSLESPSDEGNTNLLRAESEETQDAESIVEEPSVVKIAIEAPFQQAIAEKEAIAEPFRNETKSDKLVQGRGAEPDDVEPSPTETTFSEELKREAQLDYDVILGVTGASPQFGILGEVSGRKVALDLNQTHTISLFGVQGGGKSYTLGSIIEMACLPVNNVNVLPQPLATVVFHYSPTMDYKPEFTSMVRPNSDEKQLEILREHYNANPQALSDVVILAPASKVIERQAEYPGIEVQPISFNASELKSSHWRFLMGAVGSQSMYLRQINMLMRSLRDNLTLAGLMQALDHSTMPDHLKELARTRLNFAAEYINDQSYLSNVIRPGRLLIVDLRDEFIEKDEALGLFVVMLQIFSEATYQEHSFNKLVVFDEAHKYIENQDLISGLIEVVREMRHKGTSILVASQDPPSVPISLIELSSQIILHKFNSPAWLKHIQKANAALERLTAKQMSDLGPGEAYLWSTKASEGVFTKGAEKIRCRPRVTQHGGGTKTAV